MLFAERAGAEDGDFYFHRFNVPRCAADFASAARRRQLATAARFNFEFCRRTPKVAPVEIVSYIITVLAAYLLGSIPTGYLVARARGVDIRTTGSGNIGATNVFRVLGKPAGIFVLVADGLKGYCACTWLVDLVMHPGIAGADHSGDLQRNLSLAGGITAILGHNYTCWLKFKGGKGVAT
ncbi:MAG: glycerol-3-phosphate acyltransferase, partial [Pedosphaera sp.]|nr:glycerol-3-phosphate acyltransferase [Pedosphaera sp.]